LDAGESTVDPNKPVMVNAGADDEDPKDPLDEILREFNERWFKGWDATPDDQKAKMMSMAKAVVEDEDYKTMIVGNPDQQAVDEIYAKIIDGIVRKKRKGDMSLYKEYQQNDGFKSNFQRLLIRMVENLDYLCPKLENVEDDRDVRNLIFNRLQFNQDISNGDLQVEVMKEYGERYPGMSVLDWRRIIMAYTPMVREAVKRPSGKIIEMQQHLYGMAADREEDYNSNHWGQEP
jgi:hypothetical protein